MSFYLSNGKPQSGIQGNYNLETNWKYFWFEESEN